MLQVYYYYPFSAVSDPGKLYNDLRWNLSRPQGFEAVMRVRCSQGLQVQEYAGSFCKRIPTDIDLPAIDCDKTIMVTFKYDDKFQENSECAFQCALLYTTVYGQRRIKVINLSLPCTSMLSNLFRTADLDTQFACILKQAASSILVNSLSQVREQIINLCINILHAYRKFCATVSSSGQLILPEALKLLPLYTLALVKSIGLRNDGRLDDRCYWVSHVMSLSISLAIPLVYPRMISIHDLTEKENDGSLSSSTIPLSSEHINDDGIYLLENGEDCLIYVGNMVNPDTLQKLFGVTSVDGLSTQDFWIQLLVFLVFQFDSRCIIPFYVGKPPLRPFYLSGALVKSIGLRNDGRLDDRCYWVSHVMSLSISLAIPLVYPRMISIHDLTEKENDGSLSSSTIPLSSEHINDDGIYLLENGEDCLIYVGNMVNPDTLQKLFGVTSVDGLSTQLVLQQFDNDLSEKLSDVINEIRQQRCSYLRLRLCRKGDPTGTHFLSYMVEDKTPGGLSYVEFLKAADASLLLIRNEMAIIGVCCSFHNFQHLKLTIEDVSASKFTWLGSLDLVFENFPFNVTFRQVVYDINAEVGA
ncbi:hypothetical protein ZIOFF_024250 [Zingiber officinale]|uniref:Uncharacterized protein n=1 Tax=Zingiber officinale TaxID=94328 RepID=A0A8J5GXZ7_ZINOF|nr:hypothetical protein ZIOFF_024250 [Zingiber officinale]